MFSMWTSLPLELANAVTERIGDDIAAIRLMAVGRSQMLLKNYTG
jgi:hypothetical protein